MARKPKQTPLDAIKASETEQKQRQAQLAALQKELVEANKALRERLTNEAAHLIERYFGGLNSETLEKAEEAFKAFIEPCTTVVQGDGGDVE